MSGKPIRKIHYTSDFEKLYRSLPVNLRKLTDKKDALFRTNPFTSSLETHKLTGELKNYWSFSVNKKYRVLFRFISDDEVIFYDIGNHDMYR